MKTVLRSAALAIATLLLAAPVAVQGHPRAVAASRAQRTPPPGVAILQELKKFRMFATVLNVGAHPDDENTQLIAYLAGGRLYRSGYLSVTRGDGGQNLLGPELGEKLGVARTQELLAARHIDGGQQFFTRALDYGFSKDVREALSTWDHQQVLSDVVRAFRTFRPDVVVTVFSTQPGGTHGHHTASAVLALEAFKMSGDPKAFPEQLRDLTPWQPKRILMGGRGGGGASSVAIDVGGTDEVTGESFSAIAGRSRAMHKTQGFGQGGAGGGGGGGGGRGAGAQTLTLLDGEPAAHDIIDGIDTTWNRMPGGADVARLADDAVAKFNVQDPAASVPALLALRSKAAAVASDPIVSEKRRLLDRIIMECAGISVQTTVANAEAVPGEKVDMRHTVTKQSNVAVRWVSVRFPTLKTEIRGSSLEPGVLPAMISTQTIPANTPLTQPYWLREEGTAGMFRVDDASLIGRPENPPAVPIEFVFDIGGQSIVVPDEPVQLMAGATGGASQRKLDIVSPVPMHFASGVGLFAPGTTHPVRVQVVASRPNISGVLQLDAPPNWHVTPASQTFRLAALHDSATISFNVTAPVQPDRATITMHAMVGGVRYNTQRVEINYAHIPFQLLQPAARLKATSFNLVVRGKNVGYVPGAGDDVAQDLAEMGYTVTTITAATATPARLKGLDAVVLGIRAFNVRTDLDSLMPALFAYVEQGGTVIEQYNQNSGLKSQKFAPYPLQVTSAAERVTEENAPVTVLVPEHPALNTPNKITNADFDGWVQERGTYFPSQWDSHFIPLLSMKDTSDPTPFQNSLLVAKYGRGYIVYSGLTFFRQLPAGVPGAYRLFANLLSLGQSGIVP